MEENVSSREYYLTEQAIKEYYEELLLPTNAKDDWDIFVLINRKGYWDYKILFPNGVESLRDNQEIYSDRYLEKCPLNILREKFNDKRIIIFDDSLTNGGNLFYYYLLCMSVGAKEIRPCVYSCNIYFPTEDAKSIMLRESGRITDNSFWEKLKKEDKTIDEIKKELIEEFVSKLSYKVLLGELDIEKMSRWQTTFFQKNVSPLVMDLPILNRKKGQRTPYVLLEREVFERLCAVDNENWKFVENTVYSHQEISVRASYFRFYKKELFDIFPYLAHDFIVKCKYEYKDDLVKVVFTPFAICKSISYEKILEAFHVLYQNSEFAEEIQKEFEGVENPIIKLDDDPNICKGLFRAVIFRISHYIGLKFQEMVRQEVNVELGYDWDIMKDNFMDLFIDTECAWEELFNETEFLKTLANYTDEKIDIYKANEDFYRNRVDATQERLDEYVRYKIIKKKKGIHFSLEQRIYIFEEMEYELDSVFKFESKEARRQMITNCCLKFLETNSFSNHLIVTSKDHVLYRGFRYGENSEVFLHENLWFFYIFLYAYYESFPNEELVEGYEMYMRKVKNYLKSKNYFNVWISEDGFNFLKNYFGEFTAESKLVDEIRRRRYLLEYDENENKNKIKERFIREARLIAVY